MATRETIKSNSTTSIHRSSNSQTTGSFLLDERRNNTMFNAATLSALIFSVFCLFTTNCSAAETAASKTHSSATDNNKNVIAQELDKIAYMKALLGAGTTSADADDFLSSMMQQRSGLPLKRPFAKRYYGSSLPAADFDEWKGLGGVAAPMMPAGWVQRYFSNDKRASPFYAMRGKKAAFYALRGKRSVNEDENSASATYGEEERIVRPLLLLPNSHMRKRSAAAMPAWFSRAFAPRDAYEHLYQADRSWYNNPPHAMSNGAFDADMNNNSFGRGFGSGSRGVGGEEVAGGNSNYATPQYKRAMFFAMRG